MQSRLLTNLLAEARGTSDRRAWARAVCRAASHFARQGDGAQAIASISTVRSEFETGLEPEVACWLMLAEGILNFFEMRSKDAYDRARRAYAIAKALNIDSVLPTCSAWMCHLEFNSGDYDSMVIHIDEALKSARNDDHQAGARTSLVLADAFHFAGAFDEAKPWYARCRLHATAEGDEATLSAMLHNVAAFRASNVRLSDAFDAVDPQEAHRASVEAQSAYAYDSAIGAEGLQILLPLLRGQILCVERKYSDAIELFQSIDSKNVFERLMPVMLSDMAWCLAGLERYEDAWPVLERAISLIASVKDMDDLAYACARIAYTALKCGRVGEFEFWRKRSVDAISSHRSTQAYILSRLRGIGPFPTNSEVFGKVQ